MMGDSRSLRSFGFLVGGVFLLIGTWPFALRAEAPRVWAIVAGAILVAPALVYPRALAPIHRGWMKIGRLLGWINTRIVLSVIYYLILTPIGLVLRWLGQDPLRRRFDRQAETYRLPREARPASHMRNQF